MEYADCRHFRIADDLCAQYIADDHGTVKGQPCFVIAELCNNHQGDVRLAKRMIREAKEAGASAVKFQRRTIDQLYSPAMLNTPYGGDHSFGATYGEHRKALELPMCELQKLFQYARELDILPFVTAFDEQAVDAMEEFCQSDVYKIHSGGLYDSDLLHKVASTGKPVILSTGGAQMTHIRRAVEVLESHGLQNDQIAILHCTSLYPVRDYHAHQLGYIRHLIHEFPHKVVGWSGHDNGIALASAAYTLGARIIEVHFTLDRSMRGGDQGFSLEPQGLRKLVRDLDRICQATATALDHDQRDKAVMLDERTTLAKMVRVAVAARRISKGHVIGPGDIVLRCTGRPDGFGPFAIKYLLGLEAKRMIEQGWPFTEANVGKAATVFDL